MRTVHLFFFGLYLGIAVMTMFDIMETSKVLQIIMALGLALTFIKEALEVAE